MDTAQTEGDSVPEPPPATATSHQDQDDYAHARKSKFRFKSSKSRSSRDDRDSHDNHREHHRHRHHKRHRDDRHRSHHRSKRHKPTHSSDPQDDTTTNNTRSLSPNTAFRESLFDALGDDEGAAYWESVYGQPIHTYPVPELPKGPNGELEQMSEEEYAAYVRTRMWERTREGMIEMQEELRREKQEKERREREYVEGERERRAFERAMEESLRRGRERKRRKVWRGVGEEYLRRWERINQLRERREDAGGKDLGELAFWPVESGERHDVSKEAVEEFMRLALVSVSATKDGEDGLLSVLKLERVRWHPDKIQHRYGALGINESVMRSVTEVFQIIDRMWNELKERA